MKKMVMLKGAMFVLISLFIFACSETKDGKVLGQVTDSQKMMASSVTKTSTATPADGCPSGGIWVYSGIDDNGNGTLDNFEMDKSELVCNGDNGLNALVSVDDETPGANCSNGGSKIDTGIDKNGNAVLDADEVTSTSYVCDGTSGADGTNGLNGLDGTNGLNGINGNDGLNSIVSVTTEPAGANCTNGGKKVNTGMDDNANGILDAGEVDSTSYVCDGTDGTNGTNGTNGSTGLYSLVSVTTESSGSNCSNGGNKIEVGLDDNGNGILNTTEVDSTSYVCNGLNAAPTMPTGLIANAVSASQINLSWNVSTDDVGVSGYKVYRGGSLINTVATTSYLDTGLANGTSYCYKVSAYDADGNESAKSNEVCKNSLQKLSDTGQTGDYTATFGEDSDYTINPMSFTDNQNGTVTDNNTGLMWQQQDDDVARTWADAGTYCDNLSLGGQTDWRLPNEMELMSIVNYGTYSPAIDTTFFPNTNASPSWSSATYASGTGYAWTVDFSYGYVSYYYKASNNYVRCVRGANDTPVGKNFTDNGNGTVTDNNTTLMWQKEDDNTGRTWESAISYCEGLSLAGYTDWRLPNDKELRSIVDNTKYNPAIDTTYFPNTNASYYWSSTTDASYTDNAWYVEFYTGYVNYYVKTYDYYVRCVR